MSGVDKPVITETATFAERIFAAGPLLKASDGWRREGNYLTDEYARDLIEAGLVAERRRKIDGVTRRCLVWIGPDAPAADTGPQRFALGAVVQLRSGGFPMTVISQSCGDIYTCAFLPPEPGYLSSALLGDLPSFEIHGDCLKPFVDHDDGVPF